jgi:hypothetical protein
MVNFFATTQASNNLIDINFPTKENVSLSSNPSIWKYPFATSLILNLSTWPLELNFVNPLATYQILVCKQFS